MSLERLRRRRMRNRSCGHVIVLSLGDSGWNGALEIRREHRPVLDCLHSLSPTSTMAESMQHVKHVKRFGELVGWTGKKADVDWSRDTTARSSSCHEEDHGIVRHRDKDFLYVLDPGAPIHAIENSDRNCTKAGSYHWPLTSCIT